MGGLNSTPYSGIKGFWFWMQFLLIKRKGAGGKNNAYQTGVFKDGDIFPQKALAKCSPGSQQWKIPDSITQVPLTGSSLQSGHLQCHLQNSGHPGH